MFDLKYLILRKAVIENAEKINSYNSIKDITDVEDYHNLYLDLMDKYKISLRTYSNIRFQYILDEAYFKNYDESFCERKIKQIRANMFSKNV